MPNPFVGDFSVLTAVAYVVSLKVYFFPDTPQTRALEKNKSPRAVASCGIRPTSLRQTGDRLAICAV